MGRLLFFTLFLFSLSLFSQKIIVKGSVKDSLQNPLPYTNVIAKPKDVSKNLQFAITDNEGYYKLNLQKGDTITISISYLGFKQIKYEFVANENTRKDFVLQASEEQLDEIVIEMPVTVRGDTTRYKTDKFINGTERKLKNVLEKLPGVAVDKNGNVTVQGKKVTNMLVEGKKFFGGNSKLAVENIPADAVGGVEVIDNYNELPFLKNLVDSDKMAMNIKLKEDKKRFVFGDVEVAKGNQDFYKTSANLFYYSPKTNLNFIGNLNNVNDKPFTFGDYLSFSGGVNAVFSGNFNPRGGDFSQFLQSDDVVASTQKFGALNITQTTSNKLDVSGYAIFSGSDVENIKESINQYAVNLENRTISNNADNVLGIGKLNLEYAKSSKEQWYLKSQIKHSNHKRNNRLFSEISGVENNIISNNDLVNTTLHQFIEWHKRASKKHTFSSIVNYTYSHNNNDLFWQTEDEILSGLIPVDESESVLQIFQDKVKKIHEIDGVFKHFWEINNNNHIYTTIANKFSNQIFTTNDFQLLQDNSINNFSAAGFGNDLKFSLNDFYGGLHYKFRSGIFTLKQGAEFHKYSWQVNQQNTVNKNKWIVLPDFLAKIEFNKSKKLKINYNLKTSFSDVSQFANRFYLQSYNRLFRGNENLENQLYHSARIYFSRFSLYRGLIFHANVSYNKQIRGVLNTVSFDNNNPNISQQNNQFLTTRLFNNPRENLNVSTFIEKRIKKIKYRLDLDYSTSNFIQEINNITQNNKNNEYSYEVGLETLFGKIPTFELGFKQSFGDFTSSNTNSSFTITEPFIKVDYSFLKGFIFNFDYRSYQYKNQTFNQNNSYEIANTILSYNKENSAWTYKISVNNLFDARFKQNSSFSDFVVSDTRTFILPRVFLISIGYNL